MQTFESFEDLAPIFEFATFDVAQKDMENAEAKVVGQCLECHKRLDLLAGELVGTDCSNNQRTKQ